MDKQLNSVQQDDLMQEIVKLGKRVSELEKEVLQLAKRIQILEP